MSLIRVDENLTKDDLTKAREDYEFYIKITVDLAQEIVIVGGEYHAAAEKKLLEECGSRQEDIWGGGFDVREKKFETNAIINLRPGANESMEILDPDLRRHFLDLVQSKFEGVEKLL